MLKDNLHIYKITDKTFFFMLICFVCSNSGDNTNKVLNENWKEFFEELRPILRDTFDAVFLQYTNQLFHKIPENELFLES